MPHSAPEVAAPSPAQRPTPLCDLRPGQTGVLTALTVRGDLTEGDAAYLRAMGLRPQARVRICRLGQPCIVEVLSSSESCGAAQCGCRIGLSRELAEHVLVTAA